MKIGIISDSHDNIENIRKGVTVFIDRGVDLVIHLGDYVNPNSVRAFRGIRLVGIFGNNDGDRFRLMNAFNEIGGEIKGDFYEFEGDALKFACYHGTEPQLRDALIECGRYDVVLYGHTHECINTRRNNTLILNPGTAHGFGNRATVVVFDTILKDVEVIEL
ncbi:MAG: metallophosphoesterase [Thermodesulfovibrionia bacterium]